MIKKINTVVYDEHLDLLIIYVDDGKIKEKFVINESKEELLAYADLIGYNGKYSTKAGNLPGHDPLRVEDLPQHVLRAFAYQQGRAKWKTIKIE